MQANPHVQECSRALVRARPVPTDQVGVDVSYGLYSYDLYSYMTYTVMAYTVMTYIVMTYTVMAYIVMAYIVRYPIDGVGVDV